MVVLCEFNIYRDANPCGESEPRLSTSAGWHGGMVANTPFAQYIYMCARSVGRASSWAVQVEHDLLPCASHDVLIPLLFGLALYVPSDKRTK